MFLREYNDINYINDLDYIDFMRFISIRHDRILEHNYNASGYSKKMTLDDYKKMIDKQNEIIAKSSDKNMTPQKFARLQRLSI